MKLFIVRMELSMVVAFRLITHLLHILSWVVVELVEGMVCECGVITLALTGTPYVYV